MLEIKNVSKTYKPKKGVPVKALDDVSLSFGETGLVFILGKSGSGKSTLLNVIGGLDKADSGEFIINGKSSKTFSQGDFDAYRNTFIGFIFQEYNILNEFNVGQNIALAMELQGKKATKEALNAILDEVDLPGFALRKPNELSGGQKQRIAIARALIKDPRIIMADEPTGALDSNTGKQVFDTLKKLSKDKLVIVVSHDREFAEYYGDRVIELADGKIISDISKYEASPDAKTDKVNIIDNNIVHIKNGNELTDKDFEVIRQYIKNYKGDILISMDAKSNSSFKQIAMINDDGGKSSFKDTDNAILANKRFTADQSKFIKSKLPYRNALKIGANSLKTKPLRLFFTILLSFVSFAMFGLADTFGAYNKESTAARSIMDLNIPYASFSLVNRIQREGNGYTYTNSNSSMGDDSTLKSIEDDTGLSLKPVYSGIDSLGNDMYLPGCNGSSSYNSYYIPKTFGLTELTQSEIQSMGYTIEGRMPTTDTEIAITKYELDVYNNFGFTPSGDNESVIHSGNVNTAAILGKHFKLSSIYGEKEVLKDVEFEIVGVVDTKVDSKYNSIKEQTESGGIIDYVIMNEFTDMISYGIHSVLFVNQGLISTAIEENLKDRVGISVSSGFNFRVFEEHSHQITSRMNTVLSLTDASNADIYWLNENDKTLSNNDILVNFNTIYLMKEAVTYSNIKLPAASLYSTNYNYERHDFIQENLGSAYNEYDTTTYNMIYTTNLFSDAVVRYAKENGVPERFKTARTADGHGYTNPDDPTQVDEYWLRDYVSFIYEYWNFELEAKYRDEQVLGAQLQIQSLKNLQNVFPSLEFNNIIKIEDRELLGFGAYTGTLANVKGFVFSTDIDNYTFVASDTYIATLGESTKNYYSGFIGAMPSDGDAIRKVVKYSYDNDGKLGRTATLHNQVMSSLSDVNELIELFSTVFLYVGLGLAVFSGLLLANFIAVSIANKKKEIGILRAVGAKSKDVFTIFFNESLIIALINFILAVAGAIAGCIIFNNVFVSQLGLSVSLLSFGIRQILLMFGVSIGVALLASFFPVIAIARKQPIDSIHDK